MFKKLIALLLVFIFLSSPLFADAELTYAPYGEKEFPIWTMKLRRAESLLFGSLVITLPVSSLIWSLLSSFDVVHADNDMQAFLYQLGMAGALSAVISTADFIIGEVTND